MTRYFIAAEGKKKDGVALRPDDGARILVDAEGTCRSQHLEGMHATWHIYRDIASGRESVRALRCPSSLTPDQRADMFDRFPAGT